MTTPLQAPADRRSLAASAAIGACVGLAIGSAYVAGALARASVEDAQARLVAGGPVLSRPPGPTRRIAGGPAAAPAPNLGVHLAQVDLRGPAVPARDLECLSQAVYYEARGEAERGREAVAQVVINRMRHPRFPKSICGVVFQHAQAACAFSFACDGQTRHRLEPAAWEDARRIAQRALAGFALPELQLATDFRGGGGGAPPGLARVAQIGGHIFYRWTGRWPRVADPASTRSPAPPASAAPAAVTEPAVVKADAPVKPDATPLTPAA